MHAGLSLAEILSTSVPLGVHEISALVRLICDTTSAQPLESERVPLAPDRVWIKSDGSVHLSPGVVPTLRETGALLGTLYAEMRSRGIHLPAGLVLLCARATGQLEGASLPTPEEFYASLARFEPPDPRATLQSLFDSAAGALGGADTAESAVAEDSLAATTAVPDTTHLTTGHQQGVVAEGSLAADVPSSDLYDDVVLADDDVADHYVRDVDPVLLTHAGRHANGHSRLRTAALAVLLFCAGAASAVVFYLPRTAAGRVTDTTEVVVSSRAESTPRGTGGTLARERALPRAAERQPDVAPRSGEPARTKRVAPPASAKPAGAGERSGAPRAPARPQPLVAPEAVGGASMFSPSYAPKGTAVFFHTDTGRSSVLKRAEPGEGGVLHVVTILDDGSKNYHVQVSPDSRSIAFDSDRDGVRGVYVARADGAEVRRVSGQGYAAVPTWSPDGSRLAFLRAEPGRPKVWNLWTLELRSGRMTRLTSYRYGQVWSAAWFPGGERIAYSHEDRLIIRDLASGRSTSYASPRKARLVRTPAVSPDGRRIMFQVYRDGAWLLDLGDGSMRRVLDDPSAEEFTWAPDGRRVAFHSRRSGGWSLWMMAAP